MLLSITEKLLCASRLAYTIVGTGPVADNDDAQSLGLAVPAAGFAGGDELVNAGLVGESDDAIVVAFRGTLPPSSPNKGQMILDWLDDMNAGLVPDTSGLDINVHQGFRDALDALWQGVSDAIKAKPATKPIYVTGHSKGGAMAYLAAYRLKKALLPDASIYVATFAAARAGDQGFANAFNATLPHAARFEYADDIVPHMPPSDFFRTMFQTVPFLKDKLSELPAGYASAGELHFIDWSGNLVADSPVLRFERFAHLAHLMEDFDFGTIAGDHSIALGSGYAKGVASLALDLALA